MFRVFAACPRYIQGPGAAERLAAETLVVGNRPVIVIDAYVHKTLGPRLLSSFGDRQPPVVPFQGEITLVSVDALRSVAERSAPDVIVAIGGGKALDAGKAVARRLATPVISVPTVASMDGPASRGIAIYDDEHRLVLVEQLPLNPAAVVVDTSIIASAPAHFLRAGIGDAIAKKFEAEASAAGGGLNKHGTGPLRSALIAADGAYRLLRAHGAAAMRSVENGVANDDVEAVVEAAILLSALGFENSGLSIAHSLTRGLVKLRAVKDAPHGYHVAYGLLAQFAVEGRTDQEIEDLCGFYREVGLPVSLADMGLADGTDEDIAFIGELTMTSPHIRNLAVPTDLAGLLAAITRIEGFSTN